jgi:hypothetical protein
VELEFTNHARKQMAMRHITDADVEAALRRPSGPPTPGEPGTIWKWGIAAGGRILKVCVRTNDQTYVITAAWPD